MKTFLTDLMSNNIIFRDSYLAKYHRSFFFIIECLKTDRALNSFNKLNQFLIIIMQGVTDYILAVVINAFFDLIKFFVILL